MKAILVGSKRFFDGIDGFNSKDVDKVVLVENPIGFKYVRQTSGSGSCLFEWKKMSAEEFVEFTINSKLPMSVGKFLVPEFCEEIGFTIKHLKQLEPQFSKLDDKHKYEKIIFDSYIKNNSFTLTDEQKMAAYEEYRRERQ